MKGVPGDVLKVMRRLTFFFKGLTEFKVAEMNTGMCIGALKLKLRDDITIKYSEICGKDRLIWK